MKVVLDANVWVSAAISSGPSHRLVQRWLAGTDRFEIVACTSLIDEVADVLTRRPRMRRWIALEDADRYVDTLRVLVDPVPEPDPVEPVLRDANDDYLVAIARAHGADYIVTGDKDLLDWPGQRPPVITPATFEDLLTHVGDGD